ncbi:MAG: hypothetical protein GX971_11610 [Firmicutes bacterium]|nr:hypothetical protein [Bacillota bacterium]
MNVKRYIPLIVLVLLVAAATVQGLRQQSQPKLLQSQVAGTENTLEQISDFELEIELREGREIEMKYSSQGPASSNRTGQSTSGDPAVEEIRTLVEALPPLTENRPLAIIQATLDYLEIDESTVKEFELEYELMDSIKKSIELDVDRNRDDNDD